MTHDIAIGDRITFRAVTRSGAAKATRTVTGVKRSGRVTVTRYHGWANFLVRADEIISVEKRQ